ncbi:MAG: hypothetical protein KKC79_11370 [Gammaproteobacteria bacterium]|nr:hypothetical protein [Gammaproteobacteria bacterium]MBU2409229.1 hypothetical protein [Gammaproteobacteria bacterium]
MSFKLTDTDFALVAGMAIGARSVSAFMRQLIRDAAGQFGPSLPMPPPLPSRRFAAPPVDHRPAADPELVRQLAKLGNLLNQLAKGMHLCRHDGSAVDLTKLHFMLLLVDSHLEYLREEYTTRADDQVDVESGEAPP